MKDGKKRSEGKIMKVLLETVKQNKADLSQTYGDH